MTRQAYPTDLNDTQWALIAPLLTAKADYSWTTSEMESVTSWTPFCTLSEVAADELMPHDLTKWQTAYDYYWQWRNTGLWEQINAILVQKVRVSHGREPQPSAGVIDSQSVKTAVRRRRTRRGCP